MGGERGGCRLDIPLYASHGGSGGSYSPFCPASTGTAAGPPCFDRGRQFHKSESVERNAAALGHEADRRGGRARGAASIGSCQERWPALSAHLARRPNAGNGWIHPG